MTIMYPYAIRTRVPRPQPLALFPRRIIELRHSALCGQLRAGSFAWVSIFLLPCSNELTLDAGPRRGTLGIMGSTDGGLTSEIGPRLAKKVI